MFMTIRKPLTLLGAMALFSTFAHAEPTLYPPDVRVLSQIQNPTDSNILADELDSHKIWVLPPNTAKASVVGLHTLTANLGFCGEMRDLKDASADVVADIKDLTRQKMAKFAELAKLDGQASRLAEDAAKFAVDKNLQPLADLDTEIQNLETRISDLYKQQESCTKSCDNIDTELASLLKDKQVDMQQRYALAKQSSADIREYTRRQAVAKAARQTYDNAKGVYSDLSNDLLATREKFQEMFAGLGKMSGAAAGFTYVSSWADNIAKIKAANPGFAIEKVATKDAHLMTELAGVQNIDPQAAVMSISAGADLKNGVAGFPFYPESLSANVNLSLIGACPMVHPEYFDIKQDDVKSMQYGVIITYNYESVFKVKATAKYNMYKMYQKIVSSGSSGGLFSSHSWSNVEESNFFRDSFSVVWDDKENTLTPAEKDSRETEMRHAVLGRLATLAVPNTPNRADILSAAQPPTHGAVVISDSLMQTCPGNVYCVAGAAVFRVLDAIFGSSSSTASYTNIQDYELVESYENSQKITKPWMTSYL